MSCRQSQLLFGGVVHEDGGALDTAKEVLEVSSVLETSSEASVVQFFGQLGTTDLFGQGFSI